MKIDHSIKSLTGNGITENRTAGKAAAGDGKTTAVDSVDVQLSALSAQMQSIGSGGVVDAAQVAEIKQAIADGQFKINPEAIADRLLDSVKELISASRK